MIRLCLISGILLFSCLGARPANATRLSGTATGAEGKVIRVQRFDDLISFRRILADADTIGPDGTFDLEFFLPSTAYVRLSIDYHSNEILLEPGQSYSLRITDSARDLNGPGRNPFLDPPLLEYAVTDASKHPLMAAMDTLNQRYDAEVLRMFRKLSGPGRTMPSDSLRERFGAGLDISDPFLALSIRYRIGTLDDMLRSAGRAELFIRYFAGQPILYQHPDYMEFFNSFFSRYLTHVSRKIPLGELAYRVNEEKSYASVLDLLGRDSLLRSEPIRELVLLRNLREMFYTPEFVPEAVIDILNQLKRTTRIPEHRRIAENLSYRLLQMREGNHPPALTFLTPSGDSLNVAELRGKYVYLQFWTSDCGVCAADMTAMDALHERFSADVAFIGVSMDLEPAVFQSFLKTQGHAWPLVYSGGDMELIDALNIRSFPTYLLLDREGKVLSYPARGPADQTDVAFRRLLATERTPGQ